jgi:hypothetical protein
MYNEERKKRYINYKENNTIVAVNILQRLFDAIELFENSNHKDCCDFTETEILDFYKMLGTRSVDVIVNHNSRLSLYTDWCLSQGLVKDGQNHYRTLKLNNFESCINSLGIHVLKFTKEEWLESIQVLINPRDQFLLLYLFEVGTKNMYDYLGDISIDWFNGNELSLPDRTVTVSNELLHYANAADQEHYFYNYNDKIDRKFEAEETGKIIKWRVRKNSNENRGYTVLATWMSKLFKHIGYPTLKAKEVALMGQLYMFECLAVKNNISVYTAIMDAELFDIVKHQYGLEMGPNLFYRRFKGYI